MFHFESVNYNISFLHFLNEFFDSFKGLSFIYYLTQIKRKKLNQKFEWTKTSGQMKVFSLNQHDYCCCFS